MNNRLYIGNRIIETTDELKELFGLEDMAIPSSSLFSKLLDNVYDGVLQDFLRSNGEIDLAERVDGIDLNDSESSIMSRLISIMTNTEVSVSSNPMDYINVLSTTVELRENPLHFVAVFKVKVIKKDNRKIVLSITQTPPQNRTRAEEVEEKLEGAMRALKWMFNTPKHTKDKFESVLEKMDLDLNQLQRDEVVSLECDVAKNKDICFKVENSIVSVIDRKEMENMAYQEAKKHEDIKTYLELFPFGPHATELTDRKELQVYEGCTTMEKCEEYLKLYPKGQYFKEIKIRWLMFDCGFGKEIFNFSEGPTAYALAKFYYLMMILIKMKGLDGISGIAAPLMEKEGVSEEAFTAEWNQIGKLFDGHASSDYIYPRLVSSVMYRAVLQSVPSEIERLVDKNLKIVLSA